MNIGFVSTRFAGTDGVSLESRKLEAVLSDLGHNSFFCAGELDVDLPGMVVPEMHFRDAVAERLNARAFGERGSDPNLLHDINRRAEALKPALHRFVRTYAIDYIIVQNAFAIPMQLPLAQALAELFAETGLSGLAHNHDFYWERERFRTNIVGDFLDTYFPPESAGLRHATINSLAQAELRRRRGLESIVIPNVFDFATPPPGIDAYNADFRNVIGLEESDWLILQPTRVVPRKGIELAIQLVAELDDPRAKLVITHEAGDEGLGYLQELRVLAQGKNVDLRYVAELVAEQRRSDNGRKIYSLWDAYPHADLITYPSLVEGFGNALLETVYFRKPALVNRYDVYVADIAPLGFRFAEIDGAITPAVVATVRDWLEAPQGALDIVAHNFALGRAHFSYQTLRRLLAPLLRG